MDADCPPLAYEAPNVKPRSETRVLLASIAIFLIGFFGIFYFYPVGKIITYGLDAGVIYDVFTASSTWSVIWFTTWQALVSTFLSMIIGLFIANTLGKLKFRGRGFLKVLATIPFVMPTVVVASAFLSLNRFLHLEGTVFDFEGSSLGIIIAHVFFNTAIVARTVGASWMQIGMESELVAKTLGAGPIRTFFHVTLPQLKSSILASGSLAFLFTFTSFGVILLLGGLKKATIETEIWRYATQRTDFNTAAALGIAQLLIVIMMLMTNAKIRNRSKVTPETSSTESYLKSRYHRFRVFAGASFTLVFLGCPFVLLVEKSLRTPTGYSLKHYGDIFSQSNPQRFNMFAVREAIWNSLTYAGLAMVIATFLGLLAATLMTHRSQRVTKAADIMLLLPLGTSGVLIGFGIIATLHTSVLDFRSKWWIVPVAQAILGVGFVARIVASAIRNIDPKLKEVAMTLGASPYRVWRHIDVPIVSRSLVAGAMFSFAIAIGEFGATAFLARPQRPTIPTTIFNLLGRPGAATFGQAMALSVLLALITAVVVGFLDRTGSVVGNEI